MVLEILCPANTGKHLWKQELKEGRNHINGVLNNKGMRSDKGKKKREKRGDIRNAATEKRNEIQRENEKVGE